MCHTGSYGEAPLNYFDFSTCPQSVIFSVLGHLSKYSRYNVKLYGSHFYVKLGPKTRYENMSILVQLSEIGKIMFPWFLIGLYFLLQYVNVQF